MERRLLARDRKPAEVPAPAIELWTVVATLSRRQREVVVLRYIADFPEIEIARVLGVSRSTVSSTLADAHRRLGSLLDEGEDDDPV
jgi:RNA polymerase sigma factor (sigma-70 family)